MINYNLHQHSIYSDGAAEPVAYVKQALELNFKAMGFSEHSPLPFPTPFSLKAERVEAYVTEIERLKTKFQDRIILYKALEMDFIPGLSDDFDDWRKKVKLDYAIGSVHLVRPENGKELWFIDGPKREVYDEGLQKYFEGDIKKAVKAYFHQINQMIENQHFEIVGHLDKIKMHNQNRYFTEEENWYRNLLNESLDLIHEKGLVVEVNTRGLYKKRTNRLFPDDYALKHIRELNIPVLISSDAHKPEELNLLFDVAAKRLLELDFGYVAFFENGKWRELPLR